MQLLIIGADHIKAIISQIPIVYKEASTALQPLPGGIERLQERYLNSTIFLFCTKSAAERR